MDEDKFQNADNEKLENDGDETSDRPAGQFTPTESTAKKNGLNFGSKRLWLFIVPLVLLAAGLLTTLYLYQQKAARSDELSEEVVMLQESVTLKDQALAELEGAKGSDGGQIEPAGNECSQGSNYTADVGNFTVTLDEPYVIIRELDADFEGGPATRLLIASCIDGETNVFESPYQREVSILANPQFSADELRNSYESSNGTLTSEGTVEVDGITANKYSLQGLFEVNVLLFERNGIGYQIKASGTPDEFNPILNDITSDWQFE